MRRFLCERRGFDLACIGRMYEMTCYEHWKTYERIDIFPYQERDSQFPKRSCIMHEKNFYPFNHETADFRSGKGG